MITIGDFTFPERTTVLTVNTIEAKSKVRKEIRIQSMLDGSLEDLRQAIESFDRGETSLSIHPGRYYMGRRRYLRITPISSDSMAWVDFWILANDRYERSSILHTQSLNPFFGRVDFSLLNSGNWQAPLYFTIQPSNEITHVEISSAGGTFIVDENIRSDNTLVIDSEKRLVSVNGCNYCAFTNDNYPFLSSGANSLSIQIRPSEVVVGCAIQYRDFWI